MTGMWTRGRGQGDGAVWPNRCGGFKDFSGGYRRTLLRWHLDLLSLTLGERSRRDVIDCRKRNHLRKQTIFSGRANPPADAYSVTDREL